MSDTFNNISFDSLSCMVVGHNIDFMPKTVDGVVDSENLVGSEDLCTQLGDRSFNLDLRLIVDDVDDQDTYLASLCALFYSTEPAKLVLDSFPVDRYLMCQLNGDISVGTTMGYYELSIPMLATDPIWYSTILSSLSGDGVAVNLGNVPAMPILRISGPATNPKVTIGSEYFEYTGTLSPSDTLLIDTKAKTAKFNSANALKYANRIFPKLAKGSNNVSCSSGILYTTWRNGWM